MDERTKKSWTNITEMGNNRMSKIEPAKIYQAAENYRDYSAKALSDW
jgi:hypothetical protein